MSEAELLTRFRAGDAILLDSGRDNIIVEELLHFTVGRLRKVFIIGADGIEGLGRDQAHDLVAFARE